LITKSSKNIKIAHEIAECYSSVKQEIRGNFMTTLCNSLKNKGMSVKHEKTDELWVVIPEINIDGYQLYWGAAIQNNFYTIFSFCDSEGKKVLPVNDKDEAKKIVEFLNKEKKYKIDKDAVWLGWKYSHRHPELNFTKFNSPLLLSFANQNEIESVVNMIIEDALKDIEAVKQLLK